MSTILKALKKLEAEAPSKPGILAAPVGRHSRQPGKGKPFRLFGGLFGAFLILGAGFFLFFNVSPSLLVQEPAVDRLQSEDQPVTSRPRSGDGPPAVFREIVRPAGGAAPSEPEHSAQAEASGFEAASSSTRSVAAEPESLNNRDSRHNPDDREAKTGGNAGKTVENPASAAGLTQQPAGDKTPGASSEAPAPLTELTDTGLRIQAISWNEDPARRLAVINSRVCREGEHVSGYRIIRINPDDIVVSADGKRGKLLF